MVIPFVFLFITLAINIGLYGGISLALALPGALLIIAGQKIIFGDRKRGEDKSKPNSLLLWRASPHDRLDHDGLGHVIAYVLAYFYRTNTFKIKVHLKSLYVVLLFCKSFKILQDHGWQRRPE